MGELISFSRARRRKDWRVKPRSFTAWQRYLLVFVVVAALAVIHDRSTSTTSWIHTMGPDRDCDDFRTQREALRFFEAAGPGDRHLLDEDNDGIACELLA